MQSSQCFQGVCPLGLPPELCPGPIGGGGGGQHPSYPAGESIDLRSLSHINQVTRLWGGGGI